MQFFLLKGKDPIFDIHLLFIESEKLRKNKGAFLHDYTLFQKVLLEIPALKDHNLSIEAAFQKLSDAQILTSSNIKQCLKYPPRVHEVASALVEKRSERFENGSPPILTPWLNELSLFDINAALHALKLYGCFTKDTMNAVFNIMLVLKKYPEIRLKGYFPAESVRYGSDRSYRRDDVTAWQYAYSVVINFTRSLSSWGEVRYLYRKQLRSLAGLNDVLPMIIEFYILEHRRDDIQLVLPSLLPENYVRARYEQLMTQQKSGHCTD